MAIKKFKFVSDDVFGDSKTPVVDPLRNEIQSYWIKDDGLKYHKHTENDDLKYSVSIGEKLRKRGDSTLGSYTEEVTLTAKEKQWAGQSDEAFVRETVALIDTKTWGPDTVPESFLEDHTAKFNIQVPDEASNNQNTDVTFDYNFNAAAYEDITGDTGVPESDIETLYTYVYNTINDSRGGKTLNRLAEKFPTSSKNILVDPDVGSGLKNIYIPYDNVETVKSFSNESDSFPMNAMLELPFKGNTALISAFGETDVTELFMRHAAEGANNTRKYWFSNKDEEIVSDATTVASLELGEVNALKWWEEQIGGIEFGELPPEYSFLGNSNQGTFNSTSGTNVVTQISLLSWISSISNIMESNIRDFADLLEGTMAYSETIMYKVSKFAADNINGIPLQNIYIPVVKEDQESVKNETFRYVDTQVKYGKEYRYEVSAYRAIVGTAYNYTNLTFPEDFVAKFEVETRPTLRVVEVPIYEKTGRIYRKPPVIPNVNIIPYRGVGDRMLFHFNSGAGIEEFTPVILSDDDQDYYDKLKEVLDLNDDAKIEYTGETTPAAFEIYRTATKPKSYDDFKGKFRTTVSTVVNPKTFLTASSVSYVERLKPNQKYYYTFRALDSHGHPSNPTTVYEVEMINDGSTIFPIIRSHDFSLMPTYKVKNKPFKRLVQIIPKISQSVVNKEASGLTDATTAIGSGQEIKLGLDDIPIWGKNFKIRLVSKSTGKKIDFNVSVGTSHIETEKERN